MFRIVGDVESEVQGFAVWVQHQVAGIHTTGHLAVRHSKDAKFTKRENRQERRRSQIRTRTK